MVSLSESLWDLRWEDLLPRPVTSDVYVKASSFEAAIPFIVANYAEIFEDDPASPFVSGKLNDAKAKYYRAAGDFFEFVHDGRTVALLIGTPVDWSTYYIRSAASLREYQGKKLIQRFFPEMFALLAAAGVERVEADTSPSNMATLHLLTRLRFNVTGTVLSERWGALVHFTRYLDPPAERTFLGQFCAGVKYQLHEREEGRASNAG
jgi:hypothetical protein